MIQFIKSKYQQHQVKIDKYCTLAEKISSDVSDILSAEKLTAWSWVKVGFKARKYLSEYLQSNIEDFFLDVEKFDVVKDDSVKDLLIEYCRNNKKIEEIKINFNNSMSKSYDVCSLNNVVVGWKPNYYGNFDVYVEKINLMFA